MLDLGPPQTSHRCAHRGSALTRPFHRIDLTADAGCRMHPVGDQLAIDDRIDEFFKGRDRRVPRALHRERNWRRFRWPSPSGAPGKVLRPIQGPLEIAGQFRGGSPRRRTLRRMVVGDGRSMALHRLILITRSRNTAYSGCADFRAAMEFTPAARSPLRPLPRCSSDPRPPSERADARTGRRAGSCVRPCS